MSTAQEYQALALERYRIKLPSGAEFLIRQPNAFWYATNTKTLPTAAIATAHGDEPILPQDTVQLAANVSLTERLVAAHVLSPKVRHNADPAKGEIDFDDLLREDAEFILAYLLGKVDKDGNPVEEFSGK